MFSPPLPSVSRLICCFFLISSFFCFCFKSNNLEIVTKTQHTHLHTLNTRNTPENIANSPSRYLEISESGSLSDVLVSFLRCVGHTKTEQTVSPHVPLIYCHWFCCFAAERCFAHTVSAHENLMRPLYDRYTTRVRKKRKQRTSTIVNSHETLQSLMNEEVCSARSHFLIECFL